MSMFYGSEVPGVSEYEPITQELYGIMGFLHGPYSDEVDKVSADYEEFSIACSKIDSIHAKLEDENQSLKNIIAKLKHNTTVMELFCKNLEDAVKERKDVTLWGVDYMALREDADGMATHIGDKMYGDDGETVDVIGVSRYGIFYYSDTEQKTKYMHSSELHHHHEPTVEDVLCELIDAVDDDRAGQDHIIAEYAAKLRLAGDVE